MLHNKQKVICHTLIIALIIVILGSSCYSSVSAFPFQSTIHHHKVFDKKQDSASSGGDGSRSSSSHTKSSDNSNNEDSSDDNNKNNKGTNDGSNTGADNNLQAVEPASIGEQQKQGAGENVPPTGIATPTPTPQTSCEQGSNCTDQQGLSDIDRSTTDTTATEQDDTPFVLSLPFP